MNGLVGIIGLALAAVGVGLYSWPAGLVVFGIGLYADALVPRLHSRPGERKA